MLTSTVSPGPHSRCTDLVLSDLNEQELLDFELLSKDARSACFGYKDRAYRLECVLAPFFDLSEVGPFQDIQVCINRL